VHISLDGEPYALKGARTVRGGVIGAAKENHVSMGPDCQSVISLRGLAAIRL